MVEVQPLSPAPPAPAGPPVTSPPRPPEDPAAAADAPLSALRALPLLSGATDEALARLADSPGVALHDLPRDALLPTDPDRVCFVSRGQVVFGVFDCAELEQRRQQRQRDAVAGEEDGSLMPPAPLAHVARKNLALFAAGDHFNCAALASEADDGTVVAPYTLAPSLVISVGAAALEHLVLSCPPVEHSLAQAVRAAASRLTQMGGVKQEILDFYLRNGLSVAGPMVRVRQLELCIDCMQCEEACEKRHGARRLTLGGFELGLLDFVFSCRSCADARCLSPCEHDAIARQPSGEVVIDPEKCIGCSLCALSCPYGAIDMINVAEEVQPSFNPVFKARMAQAGVLEAKRGKTKRGVVRRLANKCDHCAGYAEQACVSACPTGSLIEVAPAVLFREREQPAAGRPARRSRTEELLPIEPFVHGAGVRDAGLARVRDRRFSRLVWLLGMGVWLAFLVEVVLRRYAPQLSVSYRLGRLDGLSHDVALMNVSYLAGSQLALTFGYIGTALMVLSMVYPLQRRLHLFRWSSTNKFWLDVHLMTGTVGPLFIVLHSALRLNTWVSVAFWSMVMVALSGALGRYLYTLVPSLTRSHSLELLEHRRALARLGQEHPEAGSVMRRALAGEERRVAHAQHEVGLASLLLWLLMDDLHRGWRLGRLGRRIRRVAPARVARRAGHHLGRVLLLERRQALAPRGQALLRGWKRIHIPFSMVLMVATVIHVVTALEFAH